MTPRWLILPFLLVAGDLPARVGVVDTFTRESFEGHIRFESNQVVVANAGRGLLTRVPLTNLAGIFFKPEPLADTPQPDPASQGLRALPAEWHEESIGYAASGGTTVSNGLFRLQCGGTGIGSQSDSFHFLCKPVRGDSEIILRVVLLEHGGPRASAGLMMRQSLDPNSPGAVLALTPGRGGRLVVRQESGGAATDAPLPRLRAPCWLKLRREGKTISAWSSGNGRNWRCVQRIHLPWREEIFVGVAACADRTDRLMRVTFDGLREAPSLPSTSFIPYLELQSGSVVNGPLAAADDEELRFPDPLTRSPVSTHLVANIRFQWVPDRWHRRLAAGKPGLLLRSGEFIEGDFQGIDGHQIVVSSVLLGLRRFDVHHDVVAAVLRPAKRAPARCEVRDATGSVWRGSEITLGDNEVILREASLGVQRIPLFALIELRRR